MTDDHKVALARGREQGRAVRNYLEALEAHKPRRGRRRTPDSMKKRLEVIKEQLSSVDPLAKVQLIQERMDIERELDAKQTTTDVSALEAEFVKAAKEYGGRKGISYAAWREAGVDAATLKRAGISRAAS
jgi:hypothetical protein